MVENVTHNLQVQINRLKNLPALPEASLKILEAVNDPDIDVERLVEVLSLSPALVARFLGLANSAYFGQSRQIDDLHSAIVRVLGLQLVKSLAIGVVLNVQLDVSKCKRFDAHYFWLYSLLMAITAQKLAVASRFGEFPVATVYTGGLLLHIGILVAACLVPEALDKALSTEKTGYLDINDELSHELGISHFELGYLLLNKWQLPNVYQNLLHHYEDQNLTDDAQDLRYILKASQHVCSLLLDSPDEQADRFEELAQQTHFAVNVLRKVFSEMAGNKENIEKMAEVLGSK
jgi:HD-like signal output (HDOD) protein